MRMFLTQGIGWALVAAALLDVFFTTLYARHGPLVISDYLGRGCWGLFRAVARRTPHRIRDGILSFCGPVLMVVIVTVWVSMINLGFALIIWPFLGGSIRASNGGATPSDFISALYMSGYYMTTVGNGDLQPVSGYLKMLLVLDSALGLSVITLTLTYFLQVYNALQGRNRLALSLHHRTGATGDAARLVSGLGGAGDFDGARAELSDIAEELLAVYEAHHFYPSLLYFRFPEKHHMSSRVAFIVMETATLVRSGLNEKRYAALVRSGAVTQLWEGGMQVLSELAKIYLGRTKINREAPPDEKAVRVWRKHYHEAVQHLRSEGIATIEDEQAGERKYVKLRRRWDPYVTAFANYLVHDLEEVEPSEHSKDGGQAEDSENADLDLAGYRNA